MPEALIRTLTLTKEYRVGDQTVAALRGVSVDIAVGDFVAVMGPSGSGKSTFMNLLGCLDLPSSGEYFLAGEKVSGLGNDALAAIRNQRIGFVFQQFNCHAPPRRTMSSCLFFTAACRPPNGMSARSAGSVKWALPIACTIIRRNCQAGSNNAWRSRAHWSITRC
jgi:ABC-type multidrug transport system ATPase subunit